MPGLFSPNGDTSAKNLLIAMRYSKENPEGRFDSGLWPERAWTAKQFRAWFIAKLEEKITSKMPQVNGKYATWQGQQALQMDRDRIQRYRNERIRNSGCRNLLSCKCLKDRYPEIDNQPMD